MRHTGNLVTQRISLAVMRRKLLHKNGVKAFDDINFQKLPTIKSLNDEFTELVAEKKNLYHDYSSVRDEIRTNAGFTSPMEKILGTGES